jgi:hypothetical protein
VRPLLVALNDEDVRVRGLAVDLAGRLGHVNPAVVLPALRRHLMQLLADLEHSPDSRQREGRACWILPNSCSPADSLLRYKLTSNDTGYQMYTQAAA